MTTKEDAVEQIVKELKAVQGTGPDIVIMANDPVSRLIKKSAEINGEKKQLDQLKEECAELIVAASHYDRGREGSEALHEEMLDVMLMISAVCQHIGPIPASIKLEKIQKLETWIQDQEDGA